MDQTPVNRQRLGRLAAPLTISSAIFIALLALVPRPAAATPAQPAGGAVGTGVRSTAGATFTYALADAVTGLDPAVDRSGWLVANQVFETLADYQPGGSAPIPGLAESWSTSADGLTWTFTLRPGVKFHDGTALDASAVAFNIRRWWDASHPNHAGDFSDFGYTFGGFKGDPACLLKGLAVAGDLQVQLVLSEPHGLLPSYLTMQSFAIASPAAIQSGTLLTRPVGSGPYRFAEWAPAERIRLAANPDYRNGRPRFDNLVFQVIPSEDARFTALQSNAVQGLPDLPPRYVPTATNDSNLSVLWQPSLMVGYLGINRAHPPLDQLQVRQAIAHAIDKPSILRTYYNNAAEFGLLADQLLPPVIWGRDAAIAGYAYDPPLARVLLAQAGYARGFTLTLWVLPVVRPYLPGAPAMGQTMRDNLLAVGITATLVTYNWSEYLTRTANGEADLFMLGWGADYPHPENFFAGIPCGPQHRFGPLDGPLCDQIATARRQTDYNSQLNSYLWMSRRVHDTLPLIPIAHVRSAKALRQEVAGLVPGVESDYLGNLFIASARVRLPMIIRN